MDFDYGQYFKNRFPWLFYGVLADVSNEELLEISEQFAAWHNYDPHDSQKRATEGAIVDSDDVRKEILRRMGNV